MELGYSFRDFSRQCVRDLSLLFLFRHEQIIRLSATANHAYLPSVYGAPAHQAWPNACVATAPERRAPMRESCRRLGGEQFGYI